LLEMRSGELLPGLSLNWIPPDLLHLSS
jgi:hypothetical protein